MIFCHFLHFGENFASLTTLPLSLLSQLISVKWLKVVAIDITKAGKLKKYDFSSMDLPFL